MASVMRLLWTVVGGSAVLLASACADSDLATPTSPTSTSTSTASPTPTSTASPTPTSTSIVARTNLDAFRNEAQMICADVSNELQAVAPRDGATPADAATALRSMVDANRDGVDRLRAVEAPLEFEEAFGSWLDLVDEAANHLEVGSLALRAGDDAAFAQALLAAEDAGVRASAAARDLELTGCAFSG